jgi:hypothetical protein
MMISHFEHLVKVENQPWSLETAIRGASERLVPVLMTALVAGLGLLPIAIGSGDPGREIEGPMAINCQSFEPHIQKLIIPKSVTFEVQGSRCGVAQSSWDRPRFD